MPRKLLTGCGQHTSTLIRHQLPLRSAVLAVLTANAALQTVTPTVTHVNRCKYSSGTHQGLPLVQQHFPEVWGSGCQDSSVQGNELLTNCTCKVAVGRLCLTATAGSLRQQTLALEAYASLHVAAHCYNNDSTCTVGRFQQQPE